MGNTIPKKINFEDIQLVCKKQRPLSILINTLDFNEQKCLILGTILADKEEHNINDFINNKSFHITIIIYGKNCQDEEKIIKKYFGAKEGYHATPTEISLAMALIPGSIKLPESYT